MHHIFIGHCIEGHYHVAMEGRAAFVTQKPKGCGAGCESRASDLALSGRLFKYKSSGTSFQVASCNSQSAI